MARSYDDRPTCISPAQLLERKGLQHDLSGAAQGSQETGPLRRRATHRDSARHLDPVAHAVVEADQRTRIGLQLLAICQFELHKIPARVNEGRALTAQTLQDKALAAEEAGLRSSS